MNEFRANPDDFVALVPSEFTAESIDYIVATHAESWQEELNVERTDQGWVIDHAESKIQVVVDPPIPQLAELTDTALEPFGASDFALLQRHTTIWRLCASGPFAAWPLVRTIATLAEAGASAAYLPGAMKLHSPRAIRLFAMDASPNALTNFFVSAFDANNVMRTRGLTPFRLPELETRITDGHNSAYFRLMDVSAAMIGNGRAFDDGSTLALGPRKHRVVAGGTGLIEDELEVNGLHGVMTLD